MKHKHLINLFLIISIFLLFTFCGKSVSVDGKYIIEKGPYKGIVVTLELGTFKIAGGVNGKYEIKDGKVILTATNSSFLQIMKIEGEDLVNNEYSFKRQK